MKAVQALVLSLLQASLMAVTSASGAVPPDHARKTDDHAPPAASRAIQNTPGSGLISRLIREASEGDTIVVPSGLHREHLRIDKTIILDGGGRAIIDGGGSGDIVEITAPGVTLRGFTIRNTGIDLDAENAAVRAVAPRVVIEDNMFSDILFGIDLRESPDSVVRRNIIGGKSLDTARRGDGLRLWRCDRTVIEDNIIHDGRDAILWYSTGVVIRRNTGRDCRYGLHLMFSDDVVIDDNEFSGKSVGIYLMYSTGIEIRRNRLVRNRGPSGYGIGLKESDRFVISDNVIAANRAGLYIDGSPFTTRAPGVIRRNSIAFNDVGVMFLPSARGNELTENNFIDNIDQVRVAGRGSLEANRFWSGERGNFWTDYTGYDADHNGVGDFVHEPSTLFENLMDREPSMRLFLFSPAQQAIEFVGRAFPSICPEPKFSDEVPLMRPVAIETSAATRQASPGPLAAAAALLLAVGGGITAAARAGPSTCRRDQSAIGSSLGAIP
ncbi:MAG: nitrous oxide reductase family maturation protein NosD [Phycisphaerae bacterium]|nr:nitrous oxide reductase family maturation protein NosD [Phycisphaerae bacterium]